MMLVVEWNGMIWNGKKMTNDEWKLNNKNSLVCQVNCEYYFKLALAEWKMTWLDAIPFVHFSFRAIPFVKAFHVIELSSVYVSIWMNETSEMNVWNALPFQFQLQLLIIFPTLCSTRPGQTSLI